jgi:CheY-like chemotaxis protein/MinD-like ATPase involved in chromosome partitioning or flagellar assembly
MNMNEAATRVLLVEDDEDLARLIQRTLPGASKRGIEVLWAPRLDAAVAQVRSSRFDAILLDLSLPDSSGLDTLLQMRRHSLDIPIVVLTADDDDATALSAVGQGAQDYLPKTEWRPESLARSILYAIERQKTASESAASKPGRVLAFLGARGGVGATSVALNVAAALAHTEKAPTIAIELGPCRGAFAVHLGLHPARDLSELVQPASSAISRTTILATLAEVAPNLKVLCSARKPGGCVPLEAEQAEAIIAAAGKLAEYVVLDLPPYPCAASQAAAAGSFATVLVTERDPHCIAFGRQAISMLQDWGIGGNRLGAVVVNRSLNDGISLAQVAAQLGCGLIGVVPPAPSGLAYFRDLPVTLSKPEITAAQNLTAIAKRLTGFVVQLADF